VPSVMADVEAFLAARGPLDVLQLSGGEPLVHPKLLEIIDECRKLPITYIMIDTNGRQLARDAGLAAELARRTPRLELNLQLDGLDAASHVALRGAELLAEKQAALARSVEHRLPTTLVCTVVLGVNESELGPLLKLGLQTPIVRGITFQPATWVGRYEPDANPLERVTLADVIRLLVEQSGGLLAAEDFNPLPCSDPNCCSFTYVTRRRPMIPLTRIIKYEDHIEKLADRIAFDMTHAKQCCGGDLKMDDFFRIVIKPFMDAYTYDQDRIDECCVHVVRPGGRAVSFCQFNTLERRVGREKQEEKEGEKLL
jgi:7,8-dihydro-6-hydroxymethylpterin dimethyltransferase